MTKKDFELIADIISTFEPPFSDCNQTENDNLMQAGNTKVALAYAFADILEKQNPLFNRTKFLWRCGVTEFGEI